MSPGTAAKRIIAPTTDPDLLRERRGDRPRQSPIHSCLSQSLKPQGQFTFGPEWHGKTMIWLTGKRDGEQLTLTQLGMGSDEVPESCSFRVLLDGKPQTLLRSTERELDRATGLVITYRAQCLIGDAASLEAFFDRKQLGNFTIGK